MVVCYSEGMGIQRLRVCKGIRRVVEGVNCQIKIFNRVSRWRKGITLFNFEFIINIS